MQVVLLAGGKGTRLRPLTYTTPKPLLPIMGRPMVAHILERLPSYCDEVLLTVSHRADDLRAWAAHTEDPALDGREVQIVEETEPLGTAGAVKNCALHVEDTFMVLNGDLLSDLDMAAHVATHRKRGGVGSLALHPVEDPSRFGVVAIGDDGRITQFVEKPPAEEAPSRLVNAGAYVLEPEVLDMIPEGRAVSIEREVFPELTRHPRGLYGFPFEGLWIDCGTPESYLRVHRELLVRSGRDLRLGRGTEVDVADGRLRATVLGDGVALGHAIEMEGAVVHDGASVEDDVRLVRTVVGAGARIGAGAMLTDCVVGPGERVAPGTDAKGTRFGMRGDD